jgi:uncharacterized membrane protein
MNKPYHNILIIALGFYYALNAQANYASEQYYEKDTELEDDLDKERCYCISKAGNNDCATSLHNCATLSTKDFDCSDWKYLAKGTCEDIGGSTESDN